MGERTLQGARVLLVGNFPPPWGGISVHVAELRERLQEQGVRVRVLALGGPPRATPLVRTVSGPFTLAAAVAPHAARGDLLHLHISGHTPKSWLIALAVAGAHRPFSPRALLTVHSGLLPNFLAAGAGNRRLVRMAAGGFGRILAVNPLLADALEKQGVAPARLAVAPAFCPSALLPGAPPAKMNPLRARARPLLCAAVTASPLYGARVLFQAVALLARRYPEAGLALYGPSTDEAELRELANRAGIGPRVGMLGQLDRPSALAVMLASDVFVRPTFADGDALSVREALALGRPVVASDVGFRPEGVIRFRPGDPEDLALKLCEALDRRSSVPAMPERGEAIFEVYREALGVRPQANRGRAREA